MLVILHAIVVGTRSLAAHERAMDIAKDFSRLIEAFEERLVAVESNVQKEIVSLKSVAETLLAAVQHQTGVVQSISQHRGSISSSGPAAGGVAFGSGASVSSVRIE